jgi:hypothetical protein
MGIRHSCHSFPLSALSIAHPDPGSESAVHGCAISWLIYLYGKTSSSIDPLIGVDVGFDEFPLRFHMSR